MLILEIEGRQDRREKHGCEGETSNWLPLVRAITSDQTSSFLVYGMMLQPIEPAPPWHFLLFFKNIMGHMWALPISASYLPDDRLSHANICVDKSGGSSENRFSRMHSLPRPTLVQNFFSYAVPWKMTHLKFISGF